MGKQLFDAKLLKVFSEDPNNIVIIGLDTNDGPEHPLYDERIKLPLDEAMVASIMHDGVHEPVLVRKNDTNGKAECVDGRQRVRNAREANKRLKKAGKEPVTIPMMPKKGTDGEMYGISATTNEIRKDDPPSLKAKKVRKYMSFGYTEIEASVRFGVSHQTIKNWLSMIDLDDKVLRAVDSGKIPASAAWKLAGLPREEQKAELDKMLEGGNTTVKKAQSVAKKAKARKNGEAEGYEAPGKRLVTKVLNLDKQEGGVLPSDFLKGVMWVLGDIGPNSIKGLAGLLHKATGDKE